MNHDQPFFILSNPRSGSSLLRLMCESHSKITVPPECGLIEWWHEKYGNWELKDLENGRLNEFCSDLLSSRKFESWEFDFNCFRNIVDRRRPENYANLVQCIYLAYGKRKDKIIRWGDKNNYYISKIELLKKIFPQAQFIHIIRDGRDVATSYVELKNLDTNSKYKPELTDNIIEIAKEWKNNNEKILSFFANISEDQKLIIKFEDLILHTEKICKKICKFLRVNYDDKMLHFYSENIKYALEPVEMLDWKKKTLQRPDANRIGRYKYKLNIDQINTFNEISSEVLNRFNYEV